MTERLIGFAAGSYTILLSISWLTVALLVVVVLPMAFFRRTRETAGGIIFGSSFLFGITTWLLGATMTLVSMGWFGIVLGFFLAGVGVVPLGIIGSIFILGMPEVGVSLAIMSALVFFCRFAGAALAGSGQDAPLRASSQG